ncbi:hypothetical protein COT77_03195 [Candidatus Berkelbacteria bacterium CG10_big_fil_rev_8_21_14_0_10_41_12]|uniref:Uncharacterized protein n=1 Tax=Candidatus Berkelbacteria bacterium CG10_big_fil_rev_8_21_14_0_10_41_12 TaxID=1974513 RepID=A0A2M6WWC1_9BACT|nr:MAG: hypothetical protein COT77_03195 [Candidatus Berkelbacteria bacterium CG10_big_fil_rev_8_21_14_0_10_41_12]
MPLFNGEQPTVPETIPASDDRGVEADGTERLIARVESAEKHFLGIVATEGPDSEIAREALGTYHNLLQILAGEKVDRDFWFNTEVYNTYIKAAKINPIYQDIADSAREDLEMLQ